MFRGIEKTQLSLQNWGWKKGYHERYIKEGTAMELKIDQMILLLEPISLPLPMSEPSQCLAIGLHKGQPCVCCFKMELGSQKTITCLGID